MTWGKMVWPTRCRDQAFAESSQHAMKCSSRPDMYLSQAAFEQAKALTSGRARRSACWKGVGEFFVGQSCFDRRRRRRNFDCCASLCSRSCSLSSIQQRLSTQGAQPDLRAFRANPKEWFGLVWMWNTLQDLLQQAKGETALRASTPAPHTWPNSHLSRWVWIWVGYQQPP